MVAVAAAVSWFVFLRTKDANKPTPAQIARAAEVNSSTTAPTTDDHAVAAPRGVAPNWALDIDREGPLLLEGQVVGPDGAPVSGAKVSLSSVPARSATSESDGSFSFAKLTGRTYHLGATSGKLIGSAVYKLVDKGDPVVIRLVEGATVTVTVLDDDGQPLSGAEVRSDDDHIATTDARGAATLAPVPPGWVAVRARAEGFAPETGFTTVGSSGASGQITITLHKGYPVSGTVLDEAGNPVSKAKVSVTAGSWEFGTPGPDDVTSDNEGQFTIPAMTAGSHTLAAVDGEHAPARSAPITVKDRAVSGVKITMKLGGRIAGKVVDKDRKTVPFASVRISGTGSNAWMVPARQATSDKDGAFELRGLARVKQQARAESDAAASKIVDVNLEAKLEISNLELMLEVSGTIAGTVVDEKGEPVPEVTVNAFPDIMGGAITEGIALAGMSNATTDGAGGFAIQGLPNGAYRLWAGRGSGVAWDWGQQGTAAKTGDTGVKITLPADGGLKGTIVLEGSGEAPAAVMVQVGVAPATPARAGVFDLNNVAPGTHDVAFRSPEFAKLVKRDVKIEPGKTTDLGKVIVSKGRKLAGKVVDRTGAPIAGAKIKVAEVLFSVEGDQEQIERYEQIATVRSAISDQAGEFVILGVPKKATNAMADHPTSGRSLPVPVPEGTDDPPSVTLTLRGYGSIAGKVTSKGKPLPHVNVSDSARGGGAAMLFAEADDEGNFFFERVPEGAHVVQAMQAEMMSMKSTSANVAVTAGRESKVTIDIPVGTISVTVTVKPLPNNKVDAAQVFLFSGVVAPANAKQLTDSFLQGGAQGMKFWLGAGMPMPMFEEIVAGTYSVCSMPITGSLSDPTFMQRLRENMQNVRIFCKAVTITPSPNAQTVVSEVPAMTPLPSSN